MSAQPPTIHVTPRTALLDERVGITVTGLAPGQVVSLHARTDDFFGLPSRWEAAAMFRADGSGTVDVSAQAPLSGDYEGVDLMGLFRFMKLERFESAEQHHYLADIPFNPSAPTTLTLEAGEQELATATLTRRYVAGDVQVRDVLEDGVVGRLFLPPGARTGPALIVLGGALDPGLSAQYLAALFASHGYAALALAYYGLESLPPELHDVPVETIGNAIRWLERHPMVDEERIGIYGISKGGEFALLAASVYTQLRLVLAIVPSVFVFQGLGKPMRRPPNRSPWTIGGEEVPFVPYKFSLRFGLKLLWKSLTRQSIRFDAMYRESLAASKERAEKAAIAVERINGPVLLVSAGDDVFWPSSHFTRLIADRLRSNDFTHEMVRLDYPGAGHQILPPYVPTTWLKWNGGTPENNAVANEDSWRKMLAFLHRHFAG